MGKIDSTLQIYTLGRFMVKKGDKLLTGENKRASKRWRLFQLFFTYLDRGVPQERVIDYLGLNEAVNPPEALKSLVYYLRKDLQSVSEAESERYIVSNGGLYFFNRNANYWLDAEHFEKLCNRAAYLSFNSGPEAISVYRKAFNLYQGDYLVEVGPVGWVLSGRNHYRNLYLRAVISAVELLKEAGRPEEVIDLCERGLQINPLENRLHCIMIQTLLDNGRAGQARMCYEEAMALFGQNDLEPTAALEQLSGYFKKYGNENKATAEDPDEFLKEVATREQQDGAFVCSRETFMEIYRLEKAKSERGKACVFPVKLELVGSAPEGEFRYTNELLDRILKRELRKGDVICNWDQFNFFVLLSDNSSENKSSTAMDRIKNQFELQNEFFGIKLKIQFLALR